MYRIRIDEVQGFSVEGFIQLCNPKRYVIVHHQLPTGNPHFHAFIDTDVKNANLRKKIKTAFPLLQKSDYSIKNCDDDRINEYVQYMFNTKHGNRWRLVDKSNFSDSVLNSLMEAAKEISDDFTERRKKRKDPTIYDLAVEINDTYKKIYLAEHSSLEQYTRYLEIAIKVCHNHRKAFEENLLRRLVTTAITIDSGQGRHTIIKKIIDKEFRNINI